MLRPSTLIILACWLLSLLMFSPTAANPSAPFLLLFLCGAACLIILQAAVHDNCGIMTAGSLLALVVGLTVVLKSAIPQVLWPEASTDEVYAALPVMVGALTMFAVYLAIPKSNLHAVFPQMTRLGVHRRRPDHRILMGCGLVLILARLATQQVVGLHIVASEPKIVVPARGLLFHLTGIGLLYLGALLLLESNDRPGAQRRPLVLVGALSIITYGGLGAVGGSRGALFFATVMSVGILIRSGRGTDRKVRSRSYVIGGLLAATAFVAAPAITARRGMASTSSPLSFVLSRLGGVEAFLPLLPYEGTIPLRTIIFDFTESVNTVIYSLPRGTSTGFAVTAWGVGYLSYGVIGVILVGILLGGIAALLDMWGRQASQSGSIALYLVSIIIYTALVQEGTIMAILNQFIALIGLSITIRALSGLEWLSPSRSLLAVSSGSASLPFYKSMNTRMLGGSYREL